MREREKRDCEGEEREWCGAGVCVRPQREARKWVVRVVEI